MTDLSRRTLLETTAALGAATVLSLVTIPSAATAPWRRSRSIRYSPAPRWAVPPRHAGQLRLTAFMSAANSGSGARGLAEFTGFAIGCPRRQVDGAVGLPFVRQPR